MLTSLFRKLAIPAVAGVILAAGSAAQAALIHEFVLGGEPVGSVTFSDTTPGTITALELTVDGHTFDQTHVNPFFTTWSIDGDWNLNDFTLRVSDAFLGEGSIELIFLSPASMGISEAVLDSDYIRRFEAFFSAMVTEPDDLILVPVHIPEPGTLAILGVGLAGLGLARRRRRI